MRAVILAFVFLTPLDSPQDRAKSLTPDERYQALFQEWHTAWEGFLKANSEAKTEEELEAVGNHPGRSRLKYAAGFMALAREHPRTTAAEDSLVWVASHALFGRDTEEAKRLLTRDHIRSAKLAPVFAFQVLTIGSEATEPLLREALSRTPHRDVRGMACYCHATRSFARNPDTKFRAGWLSWYSRATCVAPSPGSQLRCHARLICTFA